MQKQRVQQLGRTVRQTTQHLLFKALPVQRFFSFNSTPSRFASFFSFHFCNFRADSIDAYFFFSTEQNLRQGRIKNVRSVSSHTVTVSLPTAVVPMEQAPHLPGTVIMPEGNSGRTSVSPRSSPSPLSMSPSSPSQSPPMNHAISASPPVSPVPLTTEGISPSPSPLNILNSMSPNPLLSPNPLGHTLTPSPLTLRLGMTPSPIMSPSPLSMTTSSFSPIQMTSSIPNAQQGPIFLPKPAPLQSAFSPAKHSNSNQTPPSAAPQRKEMDNLTLAPILS